MPRTDSIIMARLTALLPLMMFVGLCARVPAAVSGGAVFLSWDWVPGIGVNLDVAVDRLPGSRTAPACGPPEEEHLEAGGARTQEVRIHE